MTGRTRTEGDLFLQDDYGALAADLPSERAAVSPRWLSMTSSSARVVLVVDDEPLLRLVASSALEDEGSTVYVAGDSDQALDELARHPEIQLLFTDVNMPGSRNGIALAEEAIARRPDLKLIVTSGRQVISDDKLPDHGTFLPKPYTLTTLIDLVAQKFDGRA